MAWGITRGALLLSATFAVASATWAGVNEWTTSGPPGGTLREIAASTTQDGVLYAAYTRSFHRSTDGGATWDTYDFTEEVLDLSVDPDDGNRVYVVVAFEGLYRTVDGGEHFTLIVSDSRGISAVAAARNGNVYYTDADGLHRSVDGGETFAAPVFATDPVIDLVVDANDSNLIYALAPTELMVSANGGTTWSFEDVGAEPLSAFAKSLDGTLAVLADEGVFVLDGSSGAWVNRRAGIHLAIAADPSAQKAFIVSALNGPQTLYRTTDGGLSWSGFGGNTNDRANRIVFPSDAPEYVIIANDAGVQRSTDGGDTWLDATHGPVASGGISLAIAGDHEESRLYAYPNRLHSALYLREDDDSWRRIGRDALHPQPFRGAVLAVQPDAPNSVFLATGIGFYHSTDGGQNWQPPHDNGAPFVGHPIEPGITAFDPSNTTTMYTIVTADVTMPRMLYRSVDEGQTWAEHSVGLEAVNVQGLIIDPANSQRMYIAAADRFTPAPSDGLYRSSDGGINWEQIAFEGEPVAEVEFDPVDSDRLYVATPSGLHVSTDGAASFTVNESLAALTGGYVDAVAIDPVIPSTMYVSTWRDASCCDSPPSSFVLRSVDSGQTWETLRSPSETPVWFVENLLLDPSAPGLLYADTGVRGIASYEIVNDLELTVSDYPPTVPAHVPASFTLNVEHGGSFAATGLTLTAELPALMSDVEVEADRGNCTVSASVLTCTLAILRPDERMRVLVTHTPSSYGVMNVDATLSAHERDDVPENNAVLAYSQANAEMDLSIDIDAPSAATLGQEVVMTVWVSNPGPLDVPEVVLNLLPYPGITLTTVPDGCPIVNDYAVCDLGTFASGATVQYTIVATASLVGVWPLEVQVSSRSGTPDYNFDDNSVEITVSVNERTPTNPGSGGSASGGGGGGGGSFGLPMLLAVILMAWRRTAVRSQ